MKHFFTGLAYIEPVEGRFWRFGSEDVYLDGIQHESLIHVSSLMNFWMFPCSLDYINLHVGENLFPLT